MTQEHPSGLGVGLYSGSPWAGATPRFAPGTKVPDAIGAETRSCHSDGRGAAAGTHTSLTHGHGRSHSSLTWSRGHGVRPGRGVSGPKLLSVPSSLGLWDRLSCIRWTLYFLDCKIICIHCEKRQEKKQQQHNYLKTAGFSLCCN